MSDEFQDVLYEKRDHVATITLNRPDKRNALTRPMIDAIAQYALEAEEDDDVRVVVLAANGDYFSVGMDRRGRTRGEAPGIKANRRSRYPEAAWRNWWLGYLFQMAKPSIAAVGGTCAGGGLSFALECDIRIASESARFATVYSKTGLPVLDGVGVLLPAAVGTSRALELMYTSRTIDAQEADRIGLVSRVVPDDALMQSARELAEEIAAGPPIANRLTKHLVQTPLRQAYDEHLPYQLYAIHVNGTMGRHDLEEGARAFMEKRPPRFEGLKKRKKPEGGSSGLLPKAR